MPPSPSEAGSVGVLLLRLAVRRAVKWALAAARQLPIEQRLSVAVMLVQREELEDLHLGEGETAGVDLTPTQGARPAARRVAVIRELSDREAALLHKLPGTRVGDARRREHLSPQHDERQLICRARDLPPALRHGLNTIASHRSGAQTAILRHDANHT